MGDYQPIDGVSVVGITGAARHGKDELAKALLRRIAGAERFAFSDAVAAVARASGLMTRRDAAALQQVGTHYRTTVSLEVWVRCLHGAIEDRRPQVAIVTGLRYPNELAWLRAVTGTLIGVRRPCAPALTDRDPSHPVEQGVADLLAQADLTFILDEYPGETARRAAFDRLAGRVIASWATART